MEEEWVPEATFTQKRLYHWHRRDIARLSAFAAGDPIFVVHLGDVTHGNVFPKAERVSSRLYDQVIIATDVLFPLFNLPNVIGGRILAGTSVHSFDHGQSERMVANLLNDEVHHHNVKVHNHLYLGIFGIKADLAHHGPGPGLRNWLKGNTLRLYSLSIMDDALKEGDDPPDIIVRAHQHRYVATHATRWARGRSFHTWAVSMPGYMLIDDWTRRAGQSPAESWVGMVAFEVINKRVLPPVELLRRIDWRKEEIVDYGELGTHQEAEG
jgi:hypothetical protein